MLAEKLLTELRVDALRAAEPVRDNMQEQARESLREVCAMTLLEVLEDCTRRGSSCISPERSCASAHRSAL